MNHYRIGLNSCVSVLANKTRFLEQGCMKNFKMHGKKHKNVQENCGSAVQKFADERSANN